MGKRGITRLSGGLLGTFLRNDLEKDMIRDVSHKSEQRKEKLLW